MSLTREGDGVRERESWARVVGDAAPRDHIVQLYQDQDFLNRAVCRFAGAALANGEGISWCQRSPTGTLSAHAAWDGDVAQLRPTLRWSVLNNNRAVTRKRRPQILPHGCRATGRTCVT